VRPRRLERRLRTAATHGIARSAVRVSSVATRPRRLDTLPLDHAARGPTSFDVYTFVTDDEQYAELTDSFASAGFQSPRARFLPQRDRSTPDGSDPYELISRIGSQQDRPYVILTHQDVRADQGVGASDLAAALERLDAFDPRWVVAGNAGGAPDLHLVRRLRDPHGGGTGDRLPARVVSLDENFLVFNRRRRPRCSPGLEGFHFYGTDACLNALLDGGTAYVIDFPVTHLSRGRRGPAYDEAKARFLAAWQPRMHFAFVRAPTELVLISRWALLRRLFGSRRMHKWLKEVVPPVRVDTLGAESQLASPAIHEDMSSPGFEERRDAGS
jgi:hypothetical protein